MMNRAELSRQQPGIRGARSVSLAVGLLAACVAAGPMHAPLLRWATSSLTEIVGRGALAFEWSMGWRVDGTANMLFCGDNQTDEPANPDVAKFAGG